MGMKRRLVGLVAAGSVFGLAGVSAVPAVAGGLAHERLAGPSGWRRLWRWRNTRGGARGRWCMWRLIVTRWMPYQQRLSGRSGGAH
ncbi:Uncharacterised protein [Mobiluncus mulieris]|nr:Uncharacterised protein [Mobiluncus mulieris]